MKRIYRSKKEQKIAGICGGIAEIVNLDPVIIRLLFIFAMFTTAIIPAVATYLVGWWIIPEGPRELPLPQPMNEDQK